MALVPPEIAQLEPVLPTSVAVLLSAADDRLALLDATLARADLAIVESATFALLRSESLSSSQIEGLNVSHPRLAESIYDPAHTKRTSIDASVVFPDAEVRPIVDDMAAANAAEAPIDQTSHSAADAGRSR